MESLVAAGAGFSTPDLYTIGLLFLGVALAAAVAALSHEHDRAFSASLIYLGGGWFVHSSGNGTTLHPFEGWYRDRFAWARRPLREAGLA